MARERMITRTVVVANYEVMAVNMGTKTVETLSVFIPSGITMTAKELDKHIKSALPDGYTFVQVMGHTLTETLYGMTETDFIKLARVLPPRTKADTEAE